MTRQDLLALDTETLAALSNRGLVKRAAKELATGAGATVTASPDGRLDGVFPDGTTAFLPPGAGLDQGVCGCGAPGLCRHLIGLVLAHQRAAAPAGGAAAPPAAAPWRPWSPGDTDDAALTAAVGARAVAAARRTLARGYTARLTHPSPDAPAAVAELPTCSVRFPVRDGVAHAVTDAADAVRGEAIALAVWAFRAAAEAPATGGAATGDDGTSGLPRQVDVGGPPPSPGPAEEPEENGPAAGTGSRRAAALDAAGALVADLLLDGAAHAGPVLAGALRRVRDRLAAASLHWPAGALTDALAQLEAYEARHARFRAEELAALLAETDARARAAGAGLAAAQILGTGERGDTPLRRVRLTALGCRISGGEGERTAEVFLAHGSAGIALVLRRRWALAEGQEPTGAALARRRLAGSTLAALAAGNVVSDSASRTPGRTVTIGATRLAATGVTPVGGSWGELPEPLLVRDFAAHAEALRRLPPRFVRPRTEADAAHVLAVDGVGAPGYDPARQVLTATVRDARGTEARIVAPYNPYSPGGLDVLAGVLRGERGRPLLLAGTVRVRGAGLELDPFGVLTTEATVVPDLAAPPSGTAEPVPPTGAGRAADPVGAALESGLAALAAVAVHGLRHLPEGARAALGDAASALARTGLGDCAGLLRRVAAVRAEQGPAAAVRPWLDAELRLLTAEELHARER